MRGTVPGDVRVGEQAEGIVGRRGGVEEDSVTLYWGIVPWGGFVPRFVHSAVDGLSSSVGDTRAEVSVPEVDLKRKEVQMEGGQTDGTNSRLPLPGPLLRASADQSDK